MLLDILKAERIRVQNNTDGVRHRTFATQGSSAFLGMERDCAQQIVFVADQMTEAAAPQDLLSFGFTSSSGIQEVP